MSILNSDPGDKLATVNVTPGNKWQYEIVTQSKSAVLPAYSFAVFNCNCSPQLHTNKCIYYHLCR